MSAASGRMPARMHREGVAVKEREQRPATRSAATSRYVGLLVCTLAGSPLLPACASRSSAAPPELARASADEPQGREVFRRECGTCHGERGDGARNVPPLTTPEALQRTFRTAQDLFDYVSTRMPLPPSKVGSLTAQEYWAVTRFMLIARGGDVPALSQSNAGQVKLD